MSLTFLFPQIDPVIFHIYGPIALRYYSLAYILGLLLGIYYLKILSYKFYSLTKKQLDDILTSSIIGIIVGGRLGYIILYNFVDYIKKPLSIFATWEGGMSFHGGLIGFAISIYIFCRKNNLDFSKLADMLSCVGPIGLFFGRIANFINSELYGRKTTTSWGVIFPGENFARHPSQLYESLSEGLLAFVILQFLFYKTNIRYYKYSLLASFLLIYSISRIVCECFRQPDIHIGFIYTSFTMGQILSIPLLIISIIILFKSKINGYRA